jgi:hypothetical protein
LQLLEILTIPCLDPQPLPHQRENHLLDPDYFWNREGALGWGQIGDWLDQPASLWGQGHSSYAFLNNRIPDTYSGGVSLHLIRVDSLQVTVGPKSNEYPKRIVRGNLTYQGTPYRMAITDPVVERQFLDGPDGSYTIENPRLCVSLGDPFQGFFYKLIAAVLYAERFR